MSQPLDRLVVERIDERRRQASGKLTLTLLLRSDALVTHRLAHYVADDRGDIRYAQSLRARHLVGLAFVSVRRQHPEADLRDVLDVDRRQVDVAGRERQDAL